MNRREMLTSLGTGLAFAGAGSAVFAGAADHKHAEHAAHLKHLTDCMNECLRCADACFKEAAAGKKGMVETGRSCADCAAFCALSIKMLTGNSAYWKEAVKACAEVCELCGATCAKTADCPHCIPCAKICKECAVACRKSVAI